MSEPRHRIPALDGLRGLAIALVLAMHFVHPPANGRWGELVYRLAHAGWIGVDLFFVLSGFLITGILADTKDRPGYFRSFYGRRILRIFPLYYAYLAFILLLPRTGELAGWLGAPYLAQHWPWFWSHTVNWLVAAEGANDSAVRAGFGALWSLSIEEQFYLVWPVVVLLLSRRAILRLCLGLVIAGLVVRLALAESGVGIPVLYHATFSRLDPLALGAMLAMIAREPGGLARIRSRWAAGVCGMALIAVLVVGYAQADRHAAELIFAVTVPAVAAAWSVVLLLTLVHEGRWRRLLETRPMRVLGKYSYALYLLQPPVIHILTRSGWTAERLGAFAYGVLGVGLTFCLALLSWHLLERHFLALKIRIPRSDEGRLPAPGLGIAMQLAPVPAKSEDAR